MVGIGNINVKGKSKEEIKKEALSQFEKQLDEMLDIKEVADESLKERKPSSISLSVKEDEGMTGYGVETDVQINGLSYEEQMTMVTTVVAQLFKQIFDNKFEGVCAIAQLPGALLHEYIEDDEDE